MMDVKMLVKAYRANKGPHGDIGWCDLDGCVEDARKYVMLRGAGWWFLCKRHYKEFTHELAYGRKDDLGKG
jgi:hypothetical protein